MSSVAGGRGRFPCTRWTLVVRAADDERGTRTGPLNELLTLYRPALEAHLKDRFRLDRHRANDLVQGFLAEKVLEKNTLKQADSKRGRFRTFLLTVFDNYVLGQLRREQAKKRAPLGPDVVSIDEHLQLSAGPQDIDAAFNVAWAEQIITQALDRMRAECEQKKRDDLWGVFECRVLEPTLDGVLPLPYEQMVARFDLKSPAAASNVLLTAKRMFRRCLGQVVRGTTPRASPRKSGASSSRKSGKLTRSFVSTAAPR